MKMTDKSSFSSADGRGKIGRWTLSCSDERKLALLDIDDIIASKFGASTARSFQNMASSLS